MVPADARTVGSVCSTSAFTFNASGAGTERCEWATAPSKPPPRGGNPVVGCKGFWAVEDSSDQSRALPPAACGLSGEDSKQGSRSRHNVPGTEALRKRKRVGKIKGCSFRGVSNLGREQA